MKTKNKIILTVVTFAFLAWSPIALCGIDIGAPEMASGTFDKIQTTVEDAGKKVNTAAQEAQKKIKGSKFMVFVEKVKAFAKSIKASVSAIQGMVETAQGVYDATTGDFSALQDIYEQNVAKVKDSSAYKAGELSKKSKDYDTKIEARKKAIQEEIDGKIRAAQENLDSLNKMIESADGSSATSTIENQRQKAQDELDQYKEQKKQIEDGSYFEQDAEYNRLVEEKREVDSELQEIGMNATSETGDKASSLAKSAAGSLLEKSDAENEQDYLKLIEQNFLKKDQPVNDKNIKPIVKFRKETIKKDITNAIKVASEIKNEIDSMDQSADDNAGNLQAADYQMTSVSFLIQQRIEDIEALYKYMSLLVADLRLKTSLNMYNQDYKLKNYDKNPAELDFDNYIFTEADFLGEKENDLLKQATEAAKEKATEAASNAASGVPNM